MTALLARAAFEVGTETVLGPLGGAGHSISTAKYRVSAVHDNKN